MKNKIASLLIIAVVALTFGCNQAVTKKVTNFGMSPDSVVSIASRLMSLVIHLY